MFKNSKKTAISKHFLISLLFVILVVTSVGVSMDNIYAQDLNQSDFGMESELNIEDKLENSHDEILTMNVESDNSLGVDENKELLGAKTISVKGTTFEDIRKAIKSADGGDTLKLSGTYNAEKKYDRIVVNKKIFFKADSSATLDGKGMSQIMFLNTSAAGSTFTNINFINGNSAGLGGAIRIETKNIEFTNCIFKDNVGLRGGAVSTIGNNKTVANMKVKNCQFINNHALISSGALEAHGDNSVIENCLFDSNSAYGDPDGHTPYGGAIQVGLDNVIARVTVSGCKFINNHVDSDRTTAHGGAGCVRNGTNYQNCIFINNSASQGGALTYHASGMIKNCTFIDNSARYYGGALATGYLYSTMDLDVVQCTFDGNTAPIGGAIQLNGMNVNVKDCKLNNNSVSKYGGAVCINAKTVNIDDSSFDNNIANINGGAVFINGTNTNIAGSSFISNDAIPDVTKLNDGLGGAIYINSTYATVKDNDFKYNTARNGSAIYYDKSGFELKLINNTLYQNQAWVYALPIYAKDIYYGESETIGSVIHGGNNIGKYGNLAISNAIYNAADNMYINIDGQTPVSGANTQDRLYQDDREYNMDILLTVKHEDGSIVYNKTLNSNVFGEVSDSLNNLKVGKYYVTAMHFEDTYYKSITNSTTFTVTAQVDDKVRKSVSPEIINYDDIVVWTLNITNNGPSNATNVVVRDILPDGLIWLEDNTNGDYNPKTGTLTIDFLEVGEIYIVTIKTQINKTGEIVNNVNVTADEYDYNITNNHDQSKINVDSAADLAVVKSANVTTVNMGDFVKWTITVRNNGPDIATGVIANDLLPKSLIWDCDDSNGKYNHDTGVWNIGTLNNGKSATLHITCKVNATGTIENEVSVSGQQYDWNKSNNHDSDKIKVNPACDLAVVKVVSESVVNYTDVVKWTLTVTNYGPNAATGVKIYDTLPNGFVYLNSTKPFSNGVIDIGSLGVGDSVSVDIYCRANITGSFVNVASVKGNQYDYNPDNNVDNASIFVKPASDLGIEKSVNNSRPDLGDLIEWTITVTNNGPNTATGVKVREVLPKSLIFVKSSGNYNNNTGIWNVGSLNNGGSARLSVVCRVNATGVIENVVSVSGNEFDWDMSNNRDSEVVNVSPACDLAVVKVVSEDVVNYMDVVKWTLTVTNYGPNAATGVKIYDTLPNGFVYLNSTKPFNKGVIDIGSLGVGSSVSVDIYCRVNITGSFVNVAAVKGNEFDHNPDNNRDNASILVKPAADLSVVKDVNASEVNINDFVKWTITVTNNGPNAATGVKVSDKLPKTLIWISDDSNGKYNHNTGIWNVGSLNNGGFARLSVVCRVNATGVIENVVSVSGNEFDWDMSNNRDSEVVNVSPACDLAVVKVVSESVVNYMDVVKWTLTVTNYGPNAATGVKIYDTLPNGFVYLNSTKPFNKGVIDIGNLGVGGSVGVDIYTKVNVTGSFVNVATVKGNEFDQNPDNNRDNASIFVKPATDLTVTKQVNESSPNYLNLVKWTITVTNNGPDDASGVIISDLLPDELIWSSDDSKGKYNPKSGIWNVGTLSNGESKHLNIISRVNATGEFVNNVSVRGNEFDWNRSNNEDNRTIKVANASDLKVIKLVNQSTVDYLQFVKWTVIAINNGPNKATGVYVEDILPEGLKLINYTATKGFYDNGIWAFCCIEPGENQTLELICEVTKTGDLTNVVTIKGNEYDPDLSNNVNNKSVSVPKSSDLSVTKTVDNSCPYYGDIVEWTITVRNNGPDGSDDVVVVDSIPDGLELISYNCSAGTYYDGIWQINHLGIDESQYLILRCLVNDLNDIENIVRVIPSQYDWNETNNNDSEKISVNPIADMSIIKFANVSQANYLDLIKWTLIVKNNGPNDASNVFVSDVLPKGLEIVDVNGGKLDDSIFYIGDLLNGQSVKLEIVCKIKATGYFINAAEVWASETDPDLSNNDAQDSVFVRPASDISITKTVSKYKYSVGDLVKFSIKLTNNGPDKAENVEVREIMDNSLLFKSVYASGGDFDEDSNVWSLDSLDVGESAFLKVKAIAKKPGTANNNVVAKSDNYDPDLSNNNDTVTINVSDKHNPVDNVKKEHIKNHDGELIKYSESILNKYVSGNPFMVIVLLFVFSMGAVCGKNIWKRR